MADNIIRGIGKLLQKEALETDAAYQKRIERHSLLLNPGKGQLARYRYDDGVIDDEARRDISAKLGASKELNLERRRLDALTHPTDYLTEKAVDLTIINNDALRHYIKVAEEFKQLDLDDDEAEKKAADAYEEYKDRRMQIHRKNYPDSITTLAEKTRSK